MSLAASMVPRVEKYDLLEEVGHGGMATVYRARDPRLNRDVAVKVIHRHLRESAEVGRRFTAEARAVAKLRHENIVEIYDVADDDAPERYLVAELVTGGSLRKILTKHGTLPAEIVACIGVEIADGLAHAHERGVVHRDVKPENVLFEIPADEHLQDDDAEVRVKLTDFGIAKMLDQQGVTATGQVLGSPAYMAPEQIECGDIDARSDVFGLGVLLYECMVGHLPFEGKNPAQVLRRVLDGIYPPADQELPTVGNKWSTLVATCLAMRVEDRYPGMEQVRDDLLVELRALGIDDIRKELLGFFRDPEAYRAALETRLVPVLVERGKQARKNDDVVGAAGHFNRALAFAPHDVALLTLVSGMTRRRERKTLAIRLGGVLGILVVSMGAAYLALRPKTQPLVVPPPPVDSAPIVSASPVKDDVPPVTGPSATAKATASAPKAVVPPSLVTLPGSGSPPDGAGTTRSVKFTIPNAGGAIVVLDGVTLEGLHGQTRELAAGTSHTYSVPTSPATATCCKPVANVGFTVPAGSTTYEVTINVPFRPALLAVDGPATEMMRCSKFGINGRPASGVIEVPLSERSLEGTCYLQSAPDRTQTVTLQPGQTKSLKWLVGAGIFLPRPTGLSMRAMRSPRALAMLAVVTAGVFPRHARADDVTAIDSAVNSYDTARWEECVERFRAVLASPTLREIPQKNRARMYYAACLISLKREKEADKQMEQVVRDDVLFVPDKAAFPGKVLDRFTETRGRLRDEIAEKEKEKILAEIAARKAEEERKKKAEERVARLERLATQETVEKESSRWIGFIPFGVGQFQNRQKALGWIFLGTETALAATTITTQLLSSSIQSQSRQANADREAARILNDRVVLTNRVAFGAFVTVAVAGIVHAQTTFVPSFRETKKRPLPDDLRVEPTVSQTGGGLSLSGSF